MIILSCTGISTITSNDSAWVKDTLNKLTLREKIAQMMVYRMNMKFMNFDSKEWNEIESLLTSDGIGLSLIHI